MKLSLNDIITYEPRSGSLWDVEFEGINVLAGKKFPAQSVSYDDIKPELETGELGPGIPYTIVKGYKFPETLSINFLDNQRLEVYEAINAYIRKSKTKTQNLFAFQGISPSEIPNHAIKVTVTEYSVEHQVIKTVVFLVVVGDNQTKNLNDNTEVQDSLQLTLRIVGMVTKDQV